MKTGISKNFWDYVEKTEGCWLFIRGGSKERYARLSVGNVSTLAHRFAYTLTHGEIPEGLCVCHRCDNPRCVRPDHLFLGSQMENVKDRCEKGRSASGANHGQRTHPGCNGYKLKSQDVIDIRAKRAAGAKHKDLAAAYGVSQSTIKTVLSRQTWAHV